MEHASLEHLPAQGFAVVPEVLTLAECEALGALVSPTAEPSGGSRGLLSQPWCASLARRLRAHPVLCSVIPAEAVAVQCTFFEKSASRNWLVPIHQDLSIPVAERVDAPVLRGWSEKEGALFVQAPVDVLERLIAVRLHLDACTRDDGPLRVCPGSHVLGRIDAESMAGARAGAPEVVCLAEPGTVVLMRPLLLHASSKGTGTSRRRVLHFLFGPRTLPHGLRWSTLA